MKNAVMKSTTEVNNAIEIKNATGVQNAIDVQNTIDVQNAIEVKNLSKSFKDFALKDVSFTLPMGSVMGFIGENGAGKTTTLKAILGLLKLDAGNVKVLGGDILDENLRERIGVVFDDSLIHKTLKIKYAEKIVGNLYKNWNSELFYDYLKRFNLDKEKKIADLSRGMRMKFSIAIALSHTPDLLILDEPTAGLDPVVREEVLDIFLEFMQDENHSILISSHITSDLDKIADYLTFIQDGEILLSDATDVLLEDSGIWKCSEDELKAVPKTAGLLRVRRGSYSLEVLIRDRAAFKKAYPNAVIDTVTTEALMLFYAKGDAISGNAISGNAISGNAISGNAISGDAISGNAISGDAIGGDAL